jgi:hypothetical protein
LAESLDMVDKYIMVATLISWQKPKKVLH